MRRQTLRTAVPLHPRFGAASVEMALVAPVVLTLIFGIMQLGYTFMVQHFLQDAARKGCRTAILPNSSNAAVNATISGLLHAEGVTNTTTTILVNNVSSDIAQAKTGDDICVTVTLALSETTLFPGFFANVSRTLQGASTLRCE